MINYDIIPKSSGVYSLTNTKTNQRYIGYSNNILRRVKEHIDRMEGGTYKYYINDKLLSAWTVDKEFFIAEVVELTEDKSREEYWTRFYNSHIDGYNYSIGTRTGERARQLHKGHPKTLGFTGKKHTTESIQKMIKSRTGLTRNDNTKHKMSESAKQVWETRSKDEASKQIQGEKNPGAKLNDSKVRAIKHLLRNGYSIKQLAEMYEVHPETIARIRRGRIWKHIQ